MKKIFTKSTLPLFAALCMYSCTDYDYGFNEKDIKYEEHFKEVFGNIDPNQDWSMATRVRAEVNLPGMEGKYTMSILTGNPGNSDTRILTQTSLIDGKASFVFDAIKGKDKVYIVAEKDGKYALCKEYSIVENQLLVGNVTRSAMTRAIQGSVSTKSAFSSTCPTTVVGDEVSIGLTYSPLFSEVDPQDDSQEKVQYIKSTLGQTNGWEKTVDEWIAYAQAKYDNYPADQKNNFKYNDGDNPFTLQSICLFEGENVIGLDFSHWELKAGCTIIWKAVDDGSSSTSTTLPTIKFQYLSNVERIPAAPWTLDVGYSLFGSGAFFEESKPYYGSTKLGVFYNESQMAEMEKGFSILTTGTEPIELPYIFGCTQYCNQFGYIYYKDSDADKVDPLALKHFVLMEDARPGENIYYNGYGASGTSVGAMTLANWNASKSGGAWSYSQILAHKGDPITCYCNENDQTQGIYTTGKHLSSCVIPYEQYLREANVPVYGSVYRPMYFGPNGESTTGSYIFPAGYRIIFFIAKLSSEPDLTNHSNYNTGNFNYSIPALNERIDHHYKIAGTYPAKKDMGMVKTITWELDGNTYLGFGDNSGDEDLNDIVFLVSGGFTTTSYVVDVAPIKWHLNLNGSHLTDDSDLFELYSLNVGATYSAPSSAPQAYGRKFLGWAEEPNSSTYTKTVNATVASAAGKCYYAIWEDTPTTPTTITYTIKWHKNEDGSHHENDNDLVVSPMNVTEGGTYSQPGTAPTRDGYNFLGWSTTPNNSNGDCSNNITNVTATANMCYYAIWQAIPQTTTTVETQSWIFACEDLGGDDDYDFNDVIWEVVKEIEVTRVDGAETGRSYKGAKVRMLAAGGTLPFTLKYDDTVICTKKQAFGSETTMYNTGQTRVAVKEYALNGIAESASINDIKSHFKLYVDQSSNETSQSKSSNAEGEYLTVVQTSAPGHSPQIVIVPSDWEWPTERTSIIKAYPRFAEWVSDANAVWNNDKVGGTTMKVTQ